VGAGRISRSTRFARDRRERNAVGANGEARMKTINGLALAVAPRGKRILISPSRRCENVQRQRFAAMGLDRSQTAILLP
jgi:hypothetical protein